MIMKKLTSYCSLNMGQSPDSKTYNTNGEGMPFYQGNADFGVIHPVTRVWCSQPVKKAKKGDILISVRAPIGAMNIAKEDCCIGRGLAALTPFAETSTEFLYYAVQSRVDSLIAQGTGSTFKAISKKVLEETLLPSFSKKEQVDIIRKLGLVDSAIAERQKQLDLLKQLVKSRFIELFGEINAPSKWEKKPWAELVTIQNGRDYKHIAVESGGYAVYGTGGEMARASDYLCPENTIIVGRKGTINNPLLVKEKFWNVDTAFGVIVGEQLHYQYFYGFCRMFDFSTLNKQAVLPSTTKADLLKIQIAVPPIELQEQFAAFVEQVDKSKFEIQKSLDELEILKKSLMQQYFG